MNGTLLLGAVAGASGVALGAFGAHGLELSAAARGTWDTAVLYHLVHALALLALAVAPWAVRGAATAFAIGIVLFSGSLYGLVLGAPAWLGPVTPLGGISLIVGWLLLAARALWPGR